MKFTTAINKLALGTQSTEENFRPKLSVLLLISLLRTVQSLSLSVLTKQVRGPGAERKEGVINGFYLHQVLLIYKIKN